jgi:hypothetical protein
MIGAVVGRHFRYALPECTNEETLEQEGRVGKEKGPVVDGALLINAFERTMAPGHKRTEAKFLTRLSDLELLGGAPTLDGRRKAQRVAAQADESL